ncbi:hypoxia up-regulated 1 [Coccidioides immitis RS]|uniref:Hypoxia up-regulated 1 n=1 Tax=Coccidioides immitis (strain RS) TaxID=246410 RepID=J3KAX4_COCIM|nr:hypoxia up-regulated 1 [Coccidioides immitis RS]EAS32212.3 hypoxia up-regulated 1 [Coccidioides immitis RS]TPX19378.1 lumenal Hsp70 protein [Coccidioides immitis]
MAPPGRRRNSRGFSLLYLLPTIFVSVLIASFPSTASAVGTGVIGIDLGTEYIKAAVVKAGVPLEIVLTKDSKRKERSAVAFKPARESGAAFPERFYGSDAVALAPRFPNDVYLNLKALLGVPFDTGVQGSDGGLQNMVSLFKERYPGVKLEPDSHDRVGIRSERLNKAEGKEPFLVEELLAMQLNQIRANAEEMGAQRTDLEDAVITIPPFFSAEERRSVQFAAELAGLNVLSLLTDGTSVAVNYATSRTFPNATNGEKPEHHVVFDMGAGSTSATVLKFQSRTVKDFGKWSKSFQEIHAVGVGWDKTLGGDALNELIVDDMVSKLVESKKLKDGTTTEQVKAHGKTMAKLWKEAERLRQILSANTETSGSFEGLYEEDVNFKYSISRSTFEELAKNHADRISKPLMDALAMAKLTLDDIGSIILHGGAIRTPFVQKQLEQVCNDAGKLRTNVNADEAAALGAAFKGAALSRSFRVKEIKTHDIPGYGASIKFVTGGKERKQKAFLPTSQIGQEKITIIKNLNDFELDFTQEHLRDNETIDYPVFHARTTNLTLALAELKDKFGCAAENITIWFGMQLNPVNAIPEITRGSASCEVEEEVKKSVVEKAKEFLGFDSKKSQQPLKDDSNKEPTSESSTASSSPNTASSESVESPTTSSSTSSETATESPSAESNVIVEGPEQPRNFRVETSIIGFEFAPLGIPRPSKEEMNRIQSRLAAFDASDLARIQREETLNSLEAFIYRARDLLDDGEFVKAITNDALEKLKQSLHEISDWLYADGSDAPTPDLKAKLDSLKQLVDPALDRKSENAQRPAKLESLKQNLKSTKMFMEVMDKQIKAEESAFSASTSKTSSPSPSETSSTIISSSEESSVNDSSSSTTSTSTSTSSSQPTPTYSTYTPVDLSILSETHDRIEKWLDEKMKLQEKLSDSDTPAITIADMEAKLAELQRALNRVMEKMTRKAKTGGGSGGSKKQGKKNGKKNKGKEKEKSKTKGEEKEEKETKKTDGKKGTTTSNKDEL